MKKEQIPLVAVLVGLVGIAIYGFVSEDIKANKLVKLCNEGKIESCDEVPEYKYELVINEIWIKKNRHTKLDGILSKKQEKYLKENVVKKSKPKSNLRKIDLVRFCEDLVKENLKDPDSYKRITNRDEQIATGIIEYTATNSFGGRVRESFQCFDPKEPF